MLLQSPVVDDACRVDGDDTWNNGVTDEMANGVLMRCADGDDGQQFGGGKDVHGVGLCARNE